MDTPRNITDTNGNLVWQWDNSDPYGANPPNENPSGLGTFNFNKRFSGQYYDVETGLNYNRNRDYDPNTGRYVESDPIGLEGGSFSPYTYVGGNPLRWVDLLGLQGADPEPGLEPVYIETLIIPAARLPSFLLKVKTWCDATDSPKGVPENWSPSPTNKGDGTMRFPRKIVFQEWRNINVTF